MADRKFDYTNVGTVYNNMKKITGDASDSESIAGILHSIDEEVHNKVDVSEEAIYGDLGKQMLLDWDNTSSNFDNFVTNFSNWSTLIAQSAGNYSQFEKDIAGFNQTNPLGVTSGGITDAYTNTGYYSTYDQAYVDSAASLVGSFVSYNGLGYIDTNMVALEEQRKTNAKWAFGIQTVATILSVVGLKGSGVFSGAAGATDDIARAAVGSTDDIARAAAGSADDVARAATSSIDDLVSKAPAVTKDKVAYVNKLIEDGTINNADDFLKFFGGSESAAKTAYTAANGGHGGGSAVRSILKGFTANADDVARTAASSADDVARAATGSSDDIASAVTNTPIQNRIDAATGVSRTPASTAGAPSSPQTSAFNPTLRDRAAGVVDKIKTKFNIGSVDDAAQAATNTPIQNRIDAVTGVSKAPASSMGAPKSSFNSAFNPVASKINSLSDSALRRVFNISDDTMEALARHGMSTRDYASYVINQDISKIPAALKSSFNSSSEFVKNAIKNGSIPSGLIPTGAGLGTNLIGENLLDDINYDNVTVTSSPYVE